MIISIVFNLFLFSFRQKVCCGIVYKGRFGEVIIDPRLFKPCCSSKKQKTLASTQVATHHPDTLPPQLPEDVKENWWLLLLNPPVGLSTASAWLCLQWQTSPYPLLQLNLLVLCNVAFSYMGFIWFFLNFCLELIFFIYIYKKTKKKKRIQALVIYRMTKNDLYWGCISGSELSLVNLY